MIEQKHHWDRTTQQIKALYCGSVVYGVCVVSRVAYGGTIKHCIELTEEFHLGGLTHTKGECIVVKEENIL